jgi:hypothetical protein
MSADVELDADFLRLLVFMHGRNLTLKLGAPTTHLSERLCALLGHLSKGSSALLGYLGKPLGTLRGKVCVCALESLSGRRHKPGDTGSESGTQIRLQLAQQGIEHQIPTQDDVY